MQESTGGSHMRSRPRALIAALLALSSAVVASAAVSWSAAASPAASPSPADTSSPVAAASPSAAGSPSSAALVYRIGSSQDVVDGVNPFSSQSGIAWESFRLCYDFLTWYDADFKPVPDAAESWEVSPDGLRWTFHLRPDLSLIHI